MSKGVFQGLRERVSTKESPLEKEIKQIEGHCQGIIVSEGAMARAKSVDELSETQRGALALCEDVIHRAENLKQGIQDFYAEKVKKIL